MRIRERASDERGMTLMEVIVAIAIMTIVALAAASVTLNGTKTESVDERQQVAVTIANGFMEKASGWTVDIDSTTGVSQLYYGRSQAAVQAAFAANSTRPGVAQTNAVWDPNAPADVAMATPPGTPSLPITESPTTTPALPPENGTSYTVTMLIGSCYQSTTIQTATNADGTPNLNNCVATAAATSDALIRVIVIVTWTAGAQCQSTPCYYETSTLVDPSSDLEWVTH
jgi:prepilin-type N-terminal cleavage/methylation domain-containing protein